MMLMRTLVSIIVTGTLVAGCSKPVKTMDVDEMDHPLMKRAKQKEQGGDTNGAVQIYRSLIDRSPDMARAHLSLALLLDRPQGDYVQAVYHYDRYLDLRQDTEKRAMIEGRVRTATLALVGTVFSNEAAVVERMNVLEHENRTLKIRNANMEAQLLQSRATVSNLRARLSASASDASKILEQRGLLEAGIQPSLPTVRVERNDTLRKIAMRVYGDQGRWRDLYEANRNVMRRPEDVRAGQVLVVPK
jgi:nucleoid-associated protein YgaU